MRYNKQTCLNTIYTLARMKGIKISKIEEAAGVSPGYFSKLRKPDNTAQLSVDVITRIAELMGVTTDMLITGAGVVLTRTEQIVYDFLDKLISDTIYKNTTWTREEPQELVSYKFEDYAYNNGNGINGFYHPLITSGMPCDLGGGEGHYVSQFYGDDIPGQENIMTGAIYNTDIGNKDDAVYVSRISHRVYDNGYISSSCEAIEVYVLDVDKSLTEAPMPLLYLRPVCCSGMAHPDIQTKMWNLYQLLDTNYSTIPMTSELEKIITDYMQQGLDIR